jgi:hypothetical protein
MSSASTIQAPSCPNCHQEMHFESRHKLDFNGGRGETHTDRFHCAKCRRFYNVPVEEKK